METIQIVQVISQERKSIMTPITNIFSRLPISRNQKWYTIIGKIDQETELNDLDVVNLVYDGIPSQVRGTAWTVLSRLDTNKNESEALVRRLLQEKLESKDLRAILEDVPRTVAMEGDSQTSLFIVLKCLAIYFPDIGYVQGMSYIAGTLMRHTTPESTLLILIKWFERNDLK